MAIRDGFPCVNISFSVSTRKRAHPGKEFDLQVLCLWHQSVWLVSGAWPAQCCCLLRSTCDLHADHVAKVSLVEERWNMACEVSGGQHLSTAGTSSEK